eukprot:COSAG01_NODE_1495_length_10123_cov_6.359537_1_plen_87_part_00
MQQLPHHRRRVVRVGLWLLHQRDPARVPAVYAARLSEVVGLELQPTAAQDSAAAAASAGAFLVVMAAVANAGVSHVPGTQLGRMPA